MAGANDDNGVREIQLNGKQLVFLFMAATVVSVVIFLCGVLVGRGVRTERAVAAEAASNAPGAEPPPAAAPAPASTAVDLTKVEPPTPPAEPVETTSHDTPAGSTTAVSTTAGNASAGNASAGNASAGNASASSASAGSTAHTNPPKAPESPPAAAGHDVKHDAKQEAVPPSAANSNTASGAGGEPQGAGFVVQVAALNVRGEADAIAKRLASKGYGAYVLPSASGSPQVFRVRVGKFASRREAESIATRLQKEEQFKPWVTR
ncbi:MAG: SPOR domain-containing protein [Acidobacteriota bacterium]